MALRFVRDHRGEAVGCGSVLVPQCFLRIDLAVVIAFVFVLAYLLCRACVGRNLRYGFGCGVDLEHDFGYSFGCGVDLEHDFGYSFGCFEVVLVVVLDDYHVEVVLVFVLEG